MVLWTPGTPVRPDARSTDGAPYVVLLTEAARDADVGAVGIGLRFGAGWLDAGSTADELLVLAACCSKRVYKNETSVKRVALEATMTPFFKTLTSLLQTGIG